MEIRIKTTLFLPGFTSFILLRECHNIYRPLKLTFRVACSVSRVTRRIQEYVRPPHVWQVVHLQ